MSHKSREDMQDWILDHEDEVTERYLEDLSEDGMTELVIELWQTDKEFKRALFEAVQRSKYMDKANESYLEIMESEGPEREEYEDR